MSYARSAFRHGVAAACMLCSTAALAQAEPKEEKPPSPWLLAPVLNSSPKLGAAGGATGGYLHKFDAESRPSIFAVTAQYSSTKSLVGGVLARTSFNQDHQRLNAPSRSATSRTTTRTISEPAFPCATMRSSNR